MRECVFDGDVQKHVHSVRTVASQGSTDGDGESEWTVEKLYVGAVGFRYPSPPPPTSTLDFPGPRLGF